MTTAPRRAAPVPPGGARTSRTGDSVSQGCTDAPGAAQREIRISLPLPPRECSPNWSGKLKDRIRAKREAREWAYYATIQKIAEIPGLYPRFQRQHVRASAAFTFPVKRTRDDDNLMASLKVFRDSIAATLGIDDNVWTWDGPPTVAIGPGEGVVITVWPVATGAAAAEEMTTNE